MKKIVKLFLAATLCSTTGLFAQNINQSIYFESGKHNLTEASKQALDQLVLDVKQYNDFDLDIKAFTDDIGTQKYNKELAEKRAATVSSYLVNCKLEASTTEVEEIGEVALLNRKNVKEQRRQNRRVDIGLNPFEPETIDDVFGYFLKRNRQEFNIRIGRDTTLIAKNGTQLFVPAGSFELAESGQGIGDDEVVISLQEAIDYQNMLMHNLTTMSDGEMIETGGMVYLDAKTKGGEQLELRDGAELRLSIPSQEQLPKDMQLFYADRPIEENAAPINWEATGQNFESTNFDQVEPLFSTQTMKFPIIPEISAPLVAEWPEHIAAPKAPILARKSKLRSTELATPNEIKAKHPQLRRESDTKYAKRLDKLIVNAKRQQQINIQFNQNAEKRYLVEKQNYEKALASYKLDLLKYNKTQSTEKEIRQQLLDNRGEIINWFNSFKWSKDYNKTVVRFMRSSQKFDKYREYLLFECERLGLDKEMKELNEMDFEMHHKLKKLGAAFSRCIRANIDFNHNHRILEIRAKVEEYLPTTKLAHPYTARVADDMIYGVYSHTILLNRLIRNYNEVLTKSGFINRSNSLDALITSMSEIRLKVVSEKIRLGLASPKEIETVYMNSVGINRIGWINCDRFRNVPNEERMIISVDMPAEPNVKLYAVFVDMKGVMPLYPQRGKDRYVAAGVPKDKEVKIFGMRVQDGKMQTAEYVGNARNLKNIKLEFKDTKLRELRRLFS